MAHVHLAFLLALMAATTPVEAQSPVGRADLFTATRYHWRGIRRSDSPVLHADAALGARIGGLSLTVGGWTGLELRSANGGFHSDLRLGHWGFAEWDGWGQAGFQLARVTIAGGVLRSTYLGPADHPAVTEAFASVHLQLDRWATSLAAWNAVDGAEGAYLEPSLSFHPFVNPFAGPAISLITSARAGIQLGARNAPAGVPGPLGTGLTHASLSAELRFGFNLLLGSALVLTTAPELQWSRDPAARLRADGQDRRVRFWAPFQAGVSWPLRRPE